MKRAPYVCVSVRLCICSFVRTGQQKSMKNATSSVISWPILILFVLSNRAWCGLHKLLHRILTIH